MLRPYINAFCRFKVDNLLYRARVLEVKSDGTAEVVFIDFGNTDVCSGKALKFNCRRKKYPPPLSLFIHYILTSRCSIVIVILMFPLEFYHLRDELSGLAITHILNKMLFFKL